MRTRTIAWGAALAAAAATFVGNADAQGYPWARAEQSRVGLDFDVWPAHEEFCFGDCVDIYTIGLGWDIHAQVEIVDNVFIAAEIPWAVFTGWADPGDSETYGAFGNPTVGAYWADTVYEGDVDLSLRLGGTLSAPTIHDDAEASFAATYAMAARGLYDMHRLVPEHIPLRMLAGVELRILPWLYYRGDFNPVIHIPTDGDAEFVIEQGNEIEARHEAGFGGGLRFQEVMLLTDNDLIQLAMEPFIGYEPEHPGFFFRLGMLTALDEDLGFGFEGGKVLSVRSTFGGKW